MGTTKNHMLPGPGAVLEALPMSYAQQRLWFFDQFERAKAAYNLQSVWLVKGPLNIAAIQYSLNEIVKRHESLRTSFRLTGEGPMQVVEPELHLELEQTDMSGLAGDEQQKALDLLIQKDAEKEFDLTHLPLIRATLARRNQDEHVLLLTMHHIISDGWSVRVLMREIGQFYGAYVTGAKPQVQELKIQYADFALWQQEWLQGERLQRQLDYWRKTLEGAPELLELPLDKTRPATQSYRGAEEELVLGAAITWRIKQLGQRYGTTLYTSLLAAFFILLKRYSGANDILVGVPVANRNRQELEALIGFFVNTLVLRLKLDENPAFSDVLRQVGEVVVSAVEHQDMPFQKLVEELHPERNLSHHPLFQVMFVLQNSHGRRGSWPGLEVSSLKQWPGAGVFDLIWSLREHNERISVRTRYNTDLFEAVTVQRMMRHYERVLEELSRDAGQRISEFRLLSEVEWEQIIGEWTRTEVSYEREKTVIELFAEQVRRTPQALALAFKQERFTYEELDQRASQLANYLRQLGVGPEICVGACMQRGPRMVIALLAIWKAGGVYVPLDPDYPSERLSYMLRDTGPLAVLCETETASIVPATSAFIKDIVGDWAEIARHSRSSPESPARAGNAAYVIYTSGSTGRPKGVVIEHRSVSNLVRAQRETFTPCESDRILQFFSFSFDVSIFAILMALGSGAGLVLATREELLPGTALVELLESESITLAVMPPLVLSHMPDAELPALRKVILGGEAWGEELMKRWGKDRRFFNSYGPTETTVQAAVGEYHLGAGRPSIGRPINNARIYLLDLEGNPVPVGVAGELYIGGDGLGRGYLDYALTAEKFVPDPFSKAPGGRLYRTGDWARWLPDGNIDLLGRKDGQIKLRGFRVELGEIESVLGEHLLVRQCAVVALPEKRNAEKRLVAYVTLLDGKRPSEKELRVYLKEKLPDYMVPAQFMILEEFPLNHSGKIDRARLPVPQVESSAGEKGPRTPEEEILCGLFAEVLERERVSVDDNFFDLGGHSLKATRLASRIRTVLGRELSLRAVFESPTVSGLAHHLRHAAGIVAPLHAQDRPVDLPLSYGQQRLWFIDQLQGESPEYNISEALRLRGPLDLAALQHSINTIVARHEVLRTHFVEKNGTPVQIIQPELLIPILVDDLSRVDEVERQELVQRTAQEESKYCFDLAQGPLLRIRLLRLAEQEHILLRTCHHIITDGWSQTIFNMEISSLYEAFQLNQDAQLPPISLQYADYALWQRQALDSTLTAQLAYWKEQLQGAPQELALPMDRPRPERQTFAADGHTTVLDRELVAALRELGRSNQVTLYMTLLAVFAVLLERYSGQQDIVVGSPIANRQDEQLESLVGFFVNSLVMRVGVDRLESFSALLSQVRKTALAAYMHQDLPFERLVEELSPHRSLNKTPIYQVMFAVQNTPLETMRLKDLELERMAAGPRHTIFDLELFAFEREAEIRFFWVYNRDLFDRWRIEQMARHYTRLLHAVVADPCTPLSSIPMLDAHEKQTLLMEWNSTARDYPAQDTVAMLFEQQAARTPHATAVICGEQSLTYRQLNERANQLGGYLKELGVGPEILVGVCLQRNLQMLVGLLGVLKAGGAYVPLDPKYPIERLRYMLEDSQAPVLLTEQALLPQIPPFSGTMVALDAQWSDIAGHSAQNPKNTAHPENLAYVIYTSGSTGKPKGVTVSQGSTATFCHWSHEVFPPDDLAGVLFSTSICFDISVFEMFAPLTCGGAVVVVENVLELAGMANVEQVKLVNTVPSALRELVHTKKIPSSVRTVNSAGEALDGALVRDIYQTTQVGRILNLYGPSEDTVFSTYISLPRSQDGKPPAIGRPIANTQAYVVDEEMQPRPVGVVGELLLGGAGLSRGYLNRPELTAERFIPDPFSSKQGSRLYRTGDLVRWAASGDIEFVGRADDQVKIRGFRIELGEIEAALRQLQDIDQAVVVAREESGEKRLAAYIVVRKREQSLSAAMLRGYLKAKLPEHMMPSYFVFLEQMPLTQNGKINRRALPKPQITSPDIYSAPASLLEQKIAKVWQDVLGVERVGLDSNFFDLGAHSLLVARVRFILCEELKRNIAIVDFFTYPTVRSLARHLDQAQQDPVNVIESQQRALGQKTNMLRRRQEFRARTDRQETV